jgi:hypothetical protein
LTGLQDLLNLKIVESFLPKKEEEEVREMISYELKRVLEEAAQRVGIEKRFIAAWANFRDGPQNSQTWWEREAEIARLWEEFVEEVSKDSFFTRLRDEVMDKKL